MSWGGIPVKTGGNKWGGAQAAAAAINPEQMSSTVAESETPDLSKMKELKTNLSSRNNEVSSLADQLSKL